MDRGETKKSLATGIEEAKKIHMTCNINRNDPITNQLIYCSQLYGTFFAVSARLNVKAGFLKSMTLTLINFKGLYNIGMLKETKRSFVPEGNGAKLTLYLKANAGRFGRDRQLKIRCNLPIDNLEGLVVTRVLKPISSSSTKQHLEEGLFDSEFYERDGYKINNLNRLDDEEVLTREDRCKTTYSNFV